MKQGVVTTELIFREVLNRGFVKAAQSFSRFTGRSVVIAPRKDDSGDTELPFKGNPDDGLVFMITTTLIGQVYGKSHLIVEKGMTAQLVTGGTGRSVAGSESEAFMEAMLKELDNIISAAVISEISDHCKMEVYGDVPELEIIPAGQIRQAMIGSLQRIDETISVSVSFIVEEHHNCPVYFIWYFDAQTLLPGSCIKTFIT